MENEIADQKQIFDAICTVLEARLKQKQERLVIEGASKMLGHQEFNDVDEAFDHIAEHNSVWPDERIWAYRFGDKVTLLHMENETQEKKNILEMKGW